MTRSLIVRLISVLWLSALAFPARADRPADHVVLVSIDGLRPEFYFDSSWPTPMLRQLLRAGAHAEAVRSVFPSVTYPSHTTMVTGALPDRHGIFYNSPFDPEGATDRWYWEAEAIRLPTLWDAVRSAGGKSAAIGWPVSVGAGVDYLVPEVWSLDSEITDIDLMRQLAMPRGLMEELEREATGRLTMNNFHIDHLTRDDRAGDMAAYLLETHQVELLLVHLIGSDHFQHEDGRESPRVRRAVAAADRAVSQIYEAAERAGILERTAFVITGDHGHVDLHSVLAPNVWLAGAGLMEDRDDRGAWRAAFHTTGASAFLHLADPADIAAIAEVRKLLDAQPRGVRGLFRIVERSELQSLGAAPEAVLALNSVPGVDFSSSASGSALGSASGATHGWIPDFPHIQTGLIASGAGIRPGASAAQLRLTDVASLVASLLGLDFETEDGTVPLGFLAVESKPD